MNKYRWILTIVFLVFWVWAAINPTFPQDWLLENCLVFVFVPMIFILGRYFKLSNASYTLITIYMILHIIGSHYGYGQVPFGFTLQKWFHLQRNMYDRLVHFAFGFLLAYPIREVFTRLVSSKGFWTYYFPFDVIAAASAIYEVLEWWASQTVNAATGIAFLGTQGDIWDTQKDMLMAMLGAILALLIIFIINRIFNKDHWKEIKESFKIPDSERPLGEEKLIEYLNRRKNI